MKRILNPGQLSTDRIVMDWLDKKGISAGDVHGYRINRQIGHGATIELTMVFDHQALPKHDTCVDISPNPTVSEWTCGKDCPTT